MEKALIITMDKFPNGDAGAIRQESLAKILVQNGYSVDVIGYGNSTDYHFCNLDNNIRYISYRGKQRSVVNRIVDRFIFPFRVNRYLKVNSQYQVVLAISLPYANLAFLKKYKRKNNAILIHDSVEWYSPCEFKMGFFSPEYIIKNCMNKYWIDTNFRAIGISRYLTDYYRDKGLLSERIPIIFDVEHIKYEKKQRTSKIRFIYAGQIGRKDHLRFFFEAICKLNTDEKQKLSVDIFGSSKEYLIKTNNIDAEIIENLGEVLTIHGRVDRKVVETQLKNSDFSILFRDSNERYAKAGFPTKVVESMLHSTPVLCNLSSDLDMYLMDGYNSIISADESVDAICTCLRRILNLSSEELEKIQKMAYQTSIENFDYKMYSGRLDKLLRKDCI